MSFMDRLTGREPQPEAGTDNVIPMRPAAYGAYRPLTASAERIDVKKKSGQDQLTDRPWGDWQEDAWDFYDAIAEIKFAYNLLAATMSRIRLYPALNLDPDAPPSSTTVVKRRRAGQTENEKIEDKRDELSPPESVTDEVMAYMEQLVMALGSGSGGVPGLLRSFALNISIAGECYLCKIDDRWSFRSTQEIQIRETDRVAVLRTIRSSGNRLTGSPRDRELPPKTYIGRIWKPHPRFSGEPDSSLLGLREICDELLTLQRMIRAVARSKMNAGMVFIPDGITSAASSVVETTEDAEQEIDPFEQEFMLSMSEPVMDEASMATVSPMVARGPKELGEGIKYLKFDRESDRSLVERADRALDRVMQGIDIPKDIVTGLANVKYSNAVKIDESLYKSHVEPLALLLCDSLTMIYLRPALKAKFPSLDPDALNKMLIWYDPTEVVSKPDPASAASALYDQLEISGAALRRANGFSDTDAPDEDEIANRLAIKGAAVLPPEVLTALAKHLLPEVFSDQQRANAEASGMPESAQQLLFPDDSESSEQADEPEREEPSSTAPEAPGVVENMADGVPTDRAGGGVQENLA